MTAYEILEEIAQQVEKPKTAEKIAKSNTDGRQQGKEKEIMRAKIGT